MENQESPQKNWAKKMLELDLQMQSGAIWTEEKSRLQKEQKSDLNDEDPDDFNGTENIDDDICYMRSDGIRISMEARNAQILDGEPTIYGGKIIPNPIHFLKQ